MGDRRAKLAVEVDGRGHAAPAQRSYDQARTEALEAEGIHVLRFWNDEVLEHPEQVIAKIHRALEARQTSEPDETR